MQISTDIHQLKPTMNPPDGGYEWWYFDGLTDDGQYGFVIILYLNNPFSTNYIKELDKSRLKVNKHPAVSISLYRKQKTIYYSFLEFEEDEFSWCEDEMSLSIENHLLKYTLSHGEVVFELELDQVLASGHSLQGVITGKAVPSNKSLIEQGSGDEHLWNLLLPSVRMKADLKVHTEGKHELIQNEFMGYHDHNYGAEPMKESFLDWYWGRYHFNDFTLIYYLMNKHKGQQFEGWLINKNHDKILARFREAELSYHQLNHFGLKSARKITLINDTTEVTIQLSKLVDNGPFYQRFIGESVVKYNGQVHATHGISEYIYPKNIYSRIFWPLVHMRLRYMNQPPHWVQKSGLLYPRTW